MFTFLFIYVPRGTYSKCGMNIFLFTQDIDLFREMFIYITQHYTRNTAISQEKVLSVHFAAFSLPDSSPTSADAAPSCPTIPAAALRARFPSLRSPARAPRPLLPPPPEKKPGKFLPELYAYSFSLFSSLSDSSPSSVSSSGTSSGSLASDASSAAASAS